MPNDSPFQSERDGDWSRVSSIPDSPWFGPRSDYNIYPDGPAEDDLGYQISIYHAVRLDVDVRIGGSFPGAPWEPPIFDADAGSTITNLPTGSYRVAYQISTVAGPPVGVGRGTSTAGNSETAQVAIVNGVSKPRVTFPSAPPAGLEYDLLLTRNTGYSGSEIYYCTGITSAYVDLVTECWYTPFARLDNPPVVTYVAPTSLLAGSIPLYHPRSDADYVASNLRWLGLSNALTIFPGGSLTLMEGRTLTLCGELWISSPLNSGNDYVTFRPGSRIVFDNSETAVPAWSDYQVWCPGSGRMRWIGAT